MQLHFFGLQPFGAIAYKGFAAARQSATVKKDMPVPKNALQPILDVRKARNGSPYFTYSVSAMVAREFRPTGELFDSVESCLYDAGMALNYYFDSVHIRYDGIALGSYAVSRLANDPLGLFDDLLGRLIATYRMRARGFVATPRLLAGTGTLSVLATAMAGDAHKA